MASKRALVVLVMLAAASHLSSCGKVPRKCSCGADPSQVVYYNGRAADIFFPDPRVVDVFRSQGREAIRIQYKVIHQVKADEETIVRTEDGGRTWVKESTRLRGPASWQLSRPAMTYGFLERGGLQRSRDGGNHWEQLQRRVNSRSPEEFSRGLTGRADAYLEVGLAAVHPRSPTTIYGCFEVSFERTTESGVVEKMPQDLPGIYVSYDAGDNWSVLSSGLRGFSAEGYCTLGINPSNPNMMIAQGRQGVVVSRDGGRKWNAVGQQAELERPAPLKGYAEALAELKGRGLKPFREWPFDWTYLIITQVEFDPASEKAVYLVTNKGVFKSEDGTRSWCLLDIGTWTLFGVGPLYIDQGNPKRIFLGTNKRVLVSEDAGCHFRIFFDWEEFTKDELPSAR